MSTQRQFKIIRDNDTKTFEDEEQFNQTVDLLESNDVDFETEEPDSEDESLDAEVIDHTEEQPTDEEVLDETIEPKADGSGEAKEAEIVQEQPDKPDTSAMIQYSGLRMQGISPTRKTARQQSTRRDCAFSNIGTKSTILNQR